MNDNIADKPNIEFTGLVDQIPHDEPALAEEQKKIDQEQYRLRETAMRKVKTAFLSVCQKYPSMARLNDLQWGTGGTHAPMATDGKTLYISPHAVIDMSFDRIELLLRHEWGHVVRKHSARCGEFITEMNDPANALIWDVLFGFGADLEVNSELVEDILKVGALDATLPGYGTYKEMPIGLTAEEYVHRIIDTPDLLKSSVLERNVLHNMNPVDPQNIDPLCDKDLVLEHVEFVRTCKWRHIARRMEYRCAAIIEDVNDPLKKDLLRKAFIVGSNLEINSDLLDRIKKLGRDDDFIPGVGEFASCPAGLLAEEYACRIMASPDLIETVRNIEFE